MAKIAIYSGVPSSVPSNILIEVLFLIFGI